MLKSGINRQWVLVEYIEGLSFKSSEIKGVLEAKDKGFLISRVWVAFLENLEAFGGCSKG